MIPNGIDTEKFRVLPDSRIKLRREWRIRDGQLLIGLVARLDPMKGHPVFLRAAALLAKERDDVRFVCVGDGPDEMELHQLSHELGLDSVLIWAGSRLDMPAVYNALDILVSSSSYGEGHSNVIVEAMACGVPCVVTNVGDSARIIGEAGGGVVVHPDDTDALFMSIQKLITGKDRWSLMDVRQSVVHRYDKRTMVLRTEKQLEENRG